MKLTLISLLLLPILLLSSCRTPVGTVEREVPIGHGQTVQDKRVMYDRNVYLEVVQVIETEVSGGITRIQVQLRSTSTRQQQINYRFRWLDLDGMASGAPGAWRPQTVLGRETIFLTATAPSDKAKDFILDIQRSQR